MDCGGSTEWQGQNDKSIFSFRKTVVMDDCMGSLSTSWAFTSGIALKTEICCGSQQGCVSVKLESSLE